MNTEKKHTINAQCFAYFFRFGANMITIGSICVILLLSILIINNPKQFSFLLIDTATNVKPINRIELYSDTGVIIKTWENVNYFAVGSKYFQFYYEGKQVKISSTATLIYEQIMP